MECTEVRLKKGEPIERALRRLKKKLTKKVRSKNSATGDALKSPAKRNAAFPAAEAEPEGFRKKRCTAKKQCIFFLVFSLQSSVFSRFCHGQNG